MPPEALTQADYRTGARIYLIAALALGALQFLAPRGPWRWTVLALAAVCLVRSVRYSLRARKH